ncbi:serine/threonine-protein kinase 11-interacting protein isoform X2 [Etheostoma spectabile]|uniref:serine/threonine-protein kinase 11-interacting protein isoform X2 n=1 Tax=Etheostoma spectabile TaxID=54343 RepID=UPI0013AFA31D|nr:serine/threonine-protein kinase 11-interacting protein isoform X2 [Etheostoma spectabile]
MASPQKGQSSLVHSLATLLRNDGDLVLDGSSTLTLPAASLQQLIRLFEQYLLPRSQQHGFLALPSHPADTASLLQLQFLFDVLQKTISLKLINPSGVRLQSVVKIFPFKSLKCLELKRIPPHCLEGLKGIYSQLEVFTCSKSLSSLEELLSLCGGDLSSALPWLELHTLNFSYNSIVCLDQSLSLLNVLKFLDLSHNKIQECAEFMKPLSELEHLNLGYNCLQRAPTLGLSARAKLLTLILRNNELETINGVEQLSSLQELDLAYNLLLEHSQLAPLSLLHCLNTLNLEGNPLYFQKTHRTCTVRHLSPKAANLRLKLDGTPLSSSELSVLPKPGRLIVQVQTAPPVAMPPERSNQDVSSGAGELSDSQSVGEVAVSHIRKKKSRSKVKVRRASISEPSDTDYEPRLLSSSQSIVLPHQHEIERMSSFRDQLGEDWLRYQHHLDEASLSTITVAVNTNPPPPHRQALPLPLPLHNGPNTTTCPSTNPGWQAAPSSLDVPEVLPPSSLPSEPVLETSVDADLEMESTLRWPGQGSQSTLEDSAVDGMVASRGVVSLPGASPESQGSAREERGDTKEEEEEEDLGVDLCHPLLVGVLSDKEEEDGEGQGEKRRRRKEVFLRIKQGLALEVDTQSGQERCRLELRSLAWVETTEAAWTRGETEEMLPAVELQFEYISWEKRRRRYVMLDDEPQQALQALTDVLSSVAEENQRRDSVLRPSCVRLQCLRCRSEFTLKGEGSEELARGRARRRGAAMLPVGVEELDQEEFTEFDDDSKGNNNICPDCGSDHVVQLAGQSSPYSSTPNQRSPRPESGDDHLDIDQSANKDDYTDGSISSSPILGAATTTEDATFVTAQGSSFFIGDGQGDTSSLSYKSEGQSKEDLAGSYHYIATGATPPEVKALPAGRSAQNDDLDLLSEDYEAVDHRLQLFLHVDVFEEEEELHSFLKMSAVKFGETGQVPSLLVVSNQRIYFLEMTSETQGQLSDWLQKRDSHPIMELSYLEVGLGSQSIHMEFGDGEVAYTLLVRDSLRCKRFFGLLTGIVREMAHKSESKLQSISTTRLNPLHHLWPLVCEDIQADVEDGQLQFFYILAFVRQEDIWTPLTVLATRETLYLLQEDHQWRRSSNSLAVTDNNEPSSGSVAILETLPISCVSSVHLWPSDQCRMDIKLYDETVKQEKTWCVRSESTELLQDLLAWVRAQWEAMFGVKLHTSLQDKAT